MQNTSTERADCYSAGEREAMVKSQEFRAWLFGPIVRELTRLEIRADHITLWSLLAGLSFCPLYFWSQGAAFAMIGLHVLLDGLDGPLARHQGTASRRGSFTDTVADQTVVAASTIAMMQGESPLVGVLGGGVYIFLYTIVVAFAMVRNALQIPYSWVIRPRFFVYGGAALEALLLRGTPLEGSLAIVLGLSNSLLALKMCSGVIKLRRAL